MDGYMFVHPYGLGNVNTAATMSTAFTMSTGIAQLQISDVFRVPLTSVNVNFESSELKLDLCVSAHTDIEEYVFSEEKDVTISHKYLLAPENHRHMDVCKNYIKDPKVTKDLYPAIKHMINIKPYLRMESKALYDYMVDLINTCSEKAKPKKT